MFKKILALVLATMMVLGGMVTVSAAEETTAPAEEVVYDYTAAAEDLAALGILKGDGIDFALQNGVTRWQMALFVARIMTGETNDQYWNKVSDNTTPYSDVVNYFGAISFADENGIIKGKGWIPGVGDNCFDPNGAITFQDAITMAVRALGSKQLAYPDGFLAVGEDLGLMEGLEPLAKDAALTRGQMIQILKNMLYVKVDGAASFAQQNFGLEENVYVIVATELQYLVGADRVYRVDYAGAAQNEQTKYVALAPLNADGTYDLDNIIHLTEAELGLAQRESETKLGYSYTIYTYNNYAGVYNVVANATKTVKNYGDEGEAIVAGSKYNAVKDNIVSVDGTTYKMVKTFTDLNNKSTYANKQPELIVHSMYNGAADITNSYYMYDVAGNILDPETYAVALIFNPYTQTYYVEVTGKDTDGNTIGLGYRVATDADFAACAVNTSRSTEQYGITTTASDLTTVSFSEMTLIDDNNDGNWDRAIYIPYSVAKYSTYTSSNYRWTVKNSAKDSSKSTAASPTLNGQYITIVGTDVNGNWGVRGGAANGCIRESDIFFAGEGRPAKNDYIVYYYNPYSRVLTVVENLGKVTAGTVQSMSQGTYAYDDLSMTYYRKGATVTIDGETYVLGYRPYETQSQYAAANKTDLTAIDENLANYGYNDKIYAALLGNAYQKMEYVVLAGRLILAGSASNTCGWMAFDYGTSTESKPGETTFIGYTSYDYEGDIVGVDADGNILVKAYVDKSGDQQIAKIGSINGFSYGLLVEDYAALQFQFSGIGSLGYNAMETMKKIVIKDFFKTLTADLDDPATEDVERQLVYIVTGVTDDGVYEIYTDLNLYWDEYVDSYYRQPATVNSKKDITLQAGVSTAKLTTEAGTDKILVLNDESVILVAGKDGLYTHTGIPKNGASIKFSKATTYALTNDFIFVASKNYDADELVTGVTFDANSNLNAYNYYMVVGQISNSKYEENTSAAVNLVDGKLVYTYSNMYCLNTGEYETLNLETPLKNFTVAYGVVGYNAQKPLGAIYVERNGVYTLYSEVVTAPSAYALGNYTYNPTVYNDLKTLLGVDSTDATYAPVYESKSTWKSASATGYTYNLSDKTIYEPFKMYQDIVTVLYADGVVTSILVSNNADTTTNVKKYSDTANYNGLEVYYTHEAGESLQATALRWYSADATVPSNIATAKTAAIAALAEAAAAHVDTDTVIGKAYASAVKAVDAAATVSAVTAAKDNGLAAIEAAVAKYYKDTLKAEELVAEVVDLLAQVAASEDVSDANKATAAIWETRVATACTNAGIMADTSALNTYKTTLAGWLKDVASASLVSANANEIELTAVDAAKKIKLTTVVLKPAMNLLVVKADETGSYDETVWKLNTNNFTCTNTGASQLWKWENQTVGAKTGVTVTIEFTPATGNVDINFAKTDLIGQDLTVLENGAYAVIIEKEVVSNIVIG